MAIQERYGLLLLKNDIRMMSDVKTEKTGFMGLAVFIMMMKEWGNNGKPKNNQQKEGEISETGAG